MAANGISTLANKRLRQDRKLVLARAKREGKTVALDGTISGNTDAVQLHTEQEILLHIANYPQDIKQIIHCLIQGSRRADWLQEDLGLNKWLIVNTMTLI
tara:strand:- start:10 stop:309 length:300 start_codon:yes stop_codon:yes gene_type:complete